MINKGEVDELLVALILVFYRDSGNLDLAPVGKVSRVGFAGKEYGSLPTGYNDISMLRRLSTPQVKNLAQDIGVTKAASSHKADIYINGRGYSFKSHRSNPPAIINHTHRFGWSRVCKELHIDINPLDIMVAEYWRLRKSGVIKEDIPNSDPNSPFAKHQEYFSPLIEYFLFKGTGVKPSVSVAEYVLDVEDPLDVSTWDVYEPKYIVAQYWDRLVFSIRNKGMPDSFPESNKRNDCISVWSEFWQDKYRGSIHVRVK